MKISWSINVRDLWNDLTFGLWIKSFMTVHSFLQIWISIFVLPQFVSERSERNSLCKQLKLYDELVVVSVILWTSSTIVSTTHWVDQKHLNWTMTRVKIFHRHIHSKLATVGQRSSKSTLANFDKKFFLLIFS